MKFKRIFLIIIDSLGIGATKDADRYGDGLSNSILNALKEEPIDLPNFKSLGLFNLFNEDEIFETTGFYTKATPNYKMKCSVISQYELMGCICNSEYERFNLDKMSKEMINCIEADIDRRIIMVPHDKGEEIIKKYGVEQMKTGKIILTYDYYNLIIYSHESVIPLNELLKLGKIIIDDMTNYGYFINKIILKTFKGATDNLILNNEQAFVPFPYKDETVLSKLKKKGYKIITIGKSSKIFNNNEITNICYTANDLETAKKLIKATDFDFEGVCVANLSELNYCGHARNVHNYVKVLKNFDNIIPLIIGHLKYNDLLIFTSDQGNDPTYSGNDHTREKIPVLVFTPRCTNGKELPYLQTLADVGATIADNFDIEMLYGKSFLNRIK